MTIEPQPIPDSRHGENLRKLRRTRADLLELDAIVRGVAMETRKFSGSTGRWDSYVDAVAAVLEHLQLNYAYDRLVISERYADGRSKDGAAYVRRLIIAEEER